MRDEIGFLTSTATRSSSRFAQPGLFAALETEGRSDTAHLGRPALFACGLQELGNGLLVRPPRRADVQLAVFPPGIGEHAVEVSALVVGQLRTRSGMRLRHFDHSSSSTASGRTGEPSTWAHCSNAHVAQSFKCSSPSRSDCISAWSSSIGVASSQLLAALQRSPALPGPCETGLTCPPRTAVTCRPRL